MKKKVIITGCTRGIGYSIAKALRKNFDVYITGTKNNKSKKHFQLDLNDTESVKKFIYKVGLFFLPLHLQMNNFCMVFKKIK